MQAHTAQIIYRIKCEGVLTEQYEEQWRIILADSQHEALQRANEVAKAEETTFVDRHGRQVQWELVGIKSLQAVDLLHGTLLFSQVQEIQPVTQPLWAETADGL